MLKKFLVTIFLILLFVSAYGCAVLVAGAAGGAGTATWLSGKLTQQVNASPEKAVEAVRSALKSLHFDIKKETTTADITQIKSNYSDGRTVWIDIRPTSKSSSQIDIRVGALSNKASAQKILDRIMKYL